MNVLELAQTHIGLTPEGSHCYRGICPTCGRTGFVVAPTSGNKWRYWQNCCGDKRGGDLADLYRLLKLKPDRGQPAPQQPVVRNRFDTDHWKKVCAIGRRNLAQPESAGWKYLSSRGLVESTWSAFGVGCGHRAGETAIMLPWYKGDWDLVGGRYRILNPAEHDKRYAWFRGSNCNGRLYGGQTHQGRATLLVVEGEINAMSIYQVANRYTDVLSTGTENATPPVSAHWAQRWQRVVCWFDKPEVAQRWAKALCGRMLTTGCADANDLLRSGTLEQELKSLCNP